ncbi:MAG: DnaJ domain-containing protein [Armatimonadota bacterium]
METAHADMDYYEVLQVHERAIPEIIDKAYRVLVRRYHPDVHPAEQRAWANARMALLNVAYDILSDPVRRAEYDAARRYGGGRVVVPESETTASAGMKCFNHPKRGALKFCWHCGRPICAECFGGESHGHTICVPCAIVIEREERWRVGMEVTETEPIRHGPRMGSAGVLVHYLLLTLLFGAILWAVYVIALAFGNPPRQALLLVIGLAVVFLVLVVQRLAWRVICPGCATAVGHADFRRHAPWNEFLAPQPICPRCGRRFKASELMQTFD